MQWFYIQQISAAVGGGTVTQNVGPFYGDPLAMTPFTGSRDNILVYIDGAWSEFRGLPLPVGR